MQRGFSLIEILIAMAIGILTITAVAGVFFTNQSGVLSGETNAEAINRAQQLIEQEQALAREDFNLVNPATSTVTVGGLTYAEVVNVSLQPDLLTKIVTVTISWLGDHGQQLSTKLSTLVTSTDNVNSPNTCNSAMSNPLGWQSPQDTPFDFQLLLYGNNSTGLSLSSVYVFDKKLYVTASSPPSNPGDSETFFVLDVSNPAIAPVFKGSFDNNTSSTDGLNAVSVASTSGKVYAYLANSHDANFNTCTQGPSCSQLQVVDATNPVPPPGWSPSIANLKLATSSGPYVLGNNITPNSGQAAGKSLFYANGYLYLGLTTTTNGPAFHIINVQNPLAPAWVGAWPKALEGIGAGGSGGPIDSIVVKGKYAYLAHPSGLIGESGPLTEEMTVLDISSSTNPVRVSGYNFNTGVGGNGKSLMAVGTTLYFGRTASNISGAADSIPEFFVLNTTDPTAIPSTVLGSTTLATAESINSLVVRDFLAFLLTTTEFKVLNMTNPLSPSTWGTLALPGNGGSAFDCQDDRFFIIHDVQKDHVSVVTPGIPFVYTLSNSADITAPKGGSGVSTITNTLSSGATAAITYSATGLPTGATAVFSPTSCSPSCTTTLTITAGASTPVGTSTISISGSPAGAVQSTTTLSLYITKATPTVTITPNPTSATVGTTLNASATLTGGSSPTGGLTFSLYGPSDPSCLAAPLFTTSDATAPYTAGTGFTSNTVGMWHWIASYAGDANNSAVSSPCANGAVTVNKATPSITEVIHDNYESTITTAALGTTTHAKATISGGYNPSGSVTFTYYTNGTCTGTGSAAGSIALVGGVAHPSTSEGPLGAGIYSFNAQYSGDGNNNTVGQCKAVTINKANPIFSTTIFNATSGLPITHAPVGTAVYDRADLAGSFGAPTGTVTFTVSKNKTNCGNPTQSGGANVALVAGSANSINYTTAGNSSYSVSYSGDANYNAITASCEPLPAP